MAAELVDLVEVGVELVLRADLPCHPDQAALDGLIVDALTNLLADVVVREASAALGAVIRAAVFGAGNRRVNRPAAERREEPESVFLDGAALRHVEVGDEIDRARRRQAAIAQLLREVVALPLTGLVRREERAAEPVAAFARNHVQANAAGRRVGADPARLITDFL